MGKFMCNLWYCGVRALYVRRAWVVRTACVSCTYGVRRLLVRRA